MALTKKAERTKAKLLESARKLISEKGFDHVAVEDITNDSGVAKGTFYHYFKCKEDVVAELSFQSSHTIVEKSIGFEGTVSGRCCYFITELYKDASWTGVRLVRQWIRESMESEIGDSRVRASLTGIHQAFLKIFTVRQGQGAGELVKDAPLDTLAKLMMGHFFGTLTIWCMVNAMWRIDDDTSAEYTKMDIDNLLRQYIIK
mgnify:CR=1 FL=1